MSGNNKKSKADSVDPVKDDFKNFLFIVWKVLGLPPPTRIQYDIADFLQYGSTRRMVEAFRGVGKSWITAAYVLWRLHKNRELKTMVVSASKERADSFSVFVKRVMHEVSFLNYLIPEKHQRSSNIAFDVAGCRPAQAPSVKSVGITGQITGSRANLIVADDIETLNNSLTQLNRDRLSEAVKEFDAVLVPEGERDIIYLGTPQTELSMYNILPERGYKLRIWTARYPKDPDKYNGQLAPIIYDELVQDSSLVWKPTDPQRFTEEDLIEREASYGRIGFALQFMLDTTLSDADRYPLKLKDLIVMDLDKEFAPVRVAWSNDREDIVQDCNPVGLVGDRYYKPQNISKEIAEYTGSVMSIDPSGRGKDRTGYAVVKTLSSKMFITSAGSIDGGYDEKTLEELATIAKENKVNAIIIESNFGDGMFTEIFKPVLRKHWNCAIEEVRHSIQKERRIIDTIEPVLNRHRLVVDRSIIIFDLKRDPEHQLFYQMTRLTYDRGSLRHDDAIDALAIAIGYWVNAMAKDEEEAYSEKLEELLDNELEKFMSNFGVTKHESWIDPW